jgi:hypothetical protein
MAFPGPLVFGVIGCAWCITGLTENYDCWSGSQYRALQCLWAAFTRTRKENPLALRETYANYLFAVFENAQMLVHKHILGAIAIPCLMQMVLVNTGEQDFPTSPSLACLLSSVRAQGSAPFHLCSQIKWICSSPKRPPLGREPHSCSLTQEETLGTREPVVWPASLPLKPWT